MKKILIAILILGAIGAGIGFYLYNKPVASLAHQKADVETTAEKLAGDYGADENLADSTYLGKVLSVQGTIADVMDEGGKKKVHLDTGNPMSLVICEMEDGSTPSNWKTGANVTIKGLCSGYLSDVILVQCTPVP